MYTWSLLGVLSKTTLHDWRLKNYFLKVINQLHEAMPNYAELVFYMFKMSSAVDCRGSKLITPDYYWLWAVCMGLGFQLLQTLVCTSYYFSILLTVDNIFKVSLCNKTVIQQ